MENKCPKCGGYLFKEIELTGPAKALFGKDYKIVPIACKCAKEGFKKSEQEAKRIDEKLKLERLLEGSMMNQKLKSICFDKWDESLMSDKYKKIAQNYVEYWDKVKKCNYGMYIYGPPGTGKTFLTACIANALMEQFIPVAFISPIEFINRIYGTYGTSQSESSLINSLNNASLLVIDDIGAEASRDKGKEIMYQILDNRLRINKPTIITSNFDMDTLKRKLDYDGIGRSVDRIMEMCTPIKIESKSIRQIKAQEKRKDFIDMLKGK